MRKGKVWKYAKWLTMMAGIAIMPLYILASDGENVAKYWRNSIGPLAMTVSFMILLFTAFSAPALVDGAENKTAPPVWALGVVIYALFGLFVPLVFGDSLYTYHPTVMRAVYLPGIIFSLNLILIMLVQVWTASEGLKLPLWAVLPVSGLFAVWVCAALINCGDMQFVGISAVVDGVLLLSLPILLIINKFRKHLHGAVWARYYKPPRGHGGHVS